MQRRIFTRSVGLTALAGITGWSRGSGAADLGSIAGRVTIKRGKLRRRDRSGVIVFLTNVPGPLPNTANTVHEIRQIDLKFVPKVSAVVIGTTLSFPNDDREYHNVFSHSGEAIPRGFDLGTYKSGTTQQVLANRPGRIDVQCDIHRQMHAVVLVLKTAHFDVSGRKGFFEVLDIPAGTYPIVAWHADGPPQNSSVTVKAGRTTEIDFTVRETKGRPRRVRKDGTFYGYKR